MVITIVSLSTYIRQCMIIIMTIDRHQKFKFLTSRCCAISDKSKLMFDSVVEIFTSAKGLGLNLVRIKLYY